MKMIISAVLAFALIVASVPAVAGDTSQAFRRLPAEERARLAPLTDDQLVVSEGAYVVDPISLIFIAQKYNIPLTKENISILTAQLLSYIQTLLHTEPTASKQYNIVWSIQTQQNTDPASATRINIVKVTQGQGTTVSITK